MRQFGLECGHPLFANEPSSRAHVKMHPVLDYLALGHPLEEKSRTNP